MGAVRRISQAFAGMVLLAEPAAIDYARDRVSQGSGGHGKHGATTVAPSTWERGEEPLAVAWADRLARMADVMERQLAEAQTGTVAKTKDSRAILAMTGVHALDVAYLHRWTEDGVRKLRARHGLDPLTGERIRRDTLTASARNQQAAYENPEED